MPGGVPHSVQFGAIWVQLAPAHALNFPATQKTCPSLFLPVRPLGPAISAVGRRNSGRAVYRTLQFIPSQAAQRPVGASPDLVCEQRSPNASQ